jgi:calpain
LTLCLREERDVIAYKLMYCIRLHGSYEAIEGGQAMDALVDLTGGIPRLYEIQDKDPFLFRMIGKAQKKGAFITCSRKVNQICLC